MTLFSPAIHRSVYYFALVLLVVSLPTSVFLLSVAQITLMINWILEGDFQRKWLVIKQRHAIAFISLFYLVHLLWMINTSDWVFGLHDLRIKLPFFVLPLVIGTSHPVDHKKLRVILLWYLASVMAVSLYSSWLIQTIDSVMRNQSPTSVSPIHSHIRWSLMVVIAIFSTAWLLKHETTKWRWILWLCLLWLVVYVFILQTLTGLVVLFAVATFMLLRQVFLSKNLILKWFAIVGILTSVLLCATYLSHAYARFHSIEKIIPTQLESRTPSGNLYHHEPNQKIVENGHYVHLYICEKELEKEWKKRSAISLDSNAKSGVGLRMALIRYLTSKGLRKDSAGIAQLSKSDIKLIERGGTNYIDSLKCSLYPRLYRVMWEMYNYQNGVDPSGCSVAQRFEFLKTASHIIQNNFWTGVGTGDSPSSFKKQYETDRSILKPEFRLRAHNQLVTFMITFGIFGFILTVLALTIPPFLEHKYNDFLFLSIFLVSFISYLNEDTLETHAGISMVALFYSLFLFYQKTSESEQEKTRD
jgi:hypothetical protein